MAIESSVLKPARADYDNPWKHVLDFYFRSFMEYCFPHIAKEINWEKRYELLDKELLKMSRDSEVGNSLADKLIKVWTKNGEEACILCHIEIDGGSKKYLFASRMLVYRYRSRDRFKNPILSIAILIDNSPNWRPSFYREECFGSSLEIHFLVVKLLDYRDKRQELEAMNNPFAMIILAQLTVIETKNKPRARLQAKTALIRQLYEKGWNKKEILQLYGLIDWLVTLPRELMLEYNEEIKHFEEEKQMNYITTAERVGIEKGLKQGLEQGIEQGMEQGLHKGMHEERIFLLIRLLQRQFGEISNIYMQKIKQADHDVLLLWYERALDADVLEEVFE